MSAKNQVQMVVDLRTVYINPQINGRQHGYLRPELEDLMSSIESRGGLIEPIVICKTPSKYAAQSGGLEYMLTAGFRRAFSCQNLAEDTTDDSWLLQPAIVMADNSIQNIVMTQLTENYCRKSMNAIDVASHMQLLSLECGMSNKQIADQLGIDPSFVTHYLRLLKLPDEVIDLIRKDEITYSAARELVRLPLDNAELRTLSVDMATKMSFGEFKKWVDARLGSTGGDDEAKGEDEVEDEGGKQKGAININSVRPKTIEADILPYIDQQIAESKDDSVKVTLGIIRDALDFVVHGIDSQTKLAAFVKPYFDHKREEAAKVEAVRHEESSKKFWFAANIKAMRDLLNPDNYGEDKPRGNVIPKTVDALQTIKARLVTELKNGKVSFKRKETTKTTAEDGTVTTTETVNDASFTYPGTADALLEEVGKAYAEHIKKIKEAAEARRVAKEAKEAADAKQEADLAEASA